MPFKTGRGQPRAKESKARRFAALKGAKGRHLKKRISLKALASRVNKISKTIETKSGVRSITDGTEYLHNTLYEVTQSNMYMFI